MDILFKTIRDANTFEQNEIHKIYNQSFPKIEKMSFDKNWKDVVWLHIKYDN